MRRYFGGRFAVDDVLERVCGRGSSCSQLPGGCAPAEVQPPVFRPRAPRESCRSPPPTASPPRRSGRSRSARREACRGGAARRRRRRSRQGQGWLRRQGRALFVASVRLYEDFAAAVRAYRLSHPDSDPVGRRAPRRRRSPWLSRCRCGRGGTGASRPGPTPAVRRRSSRGTRSRSRPGSVARMRKRTLAPAPRPAVASRVPTRGGAFLTRARRRSPPRSPRRSRRPGVRRHRVSLGPSRPKRGGATSSGR